MTDTRTTLQRIDNNVNELKNRIFIDDNCLSNKIGQNKGKIELLTQEYRNHIKTEQKNKKSSVTYITLACTVITCIAAVVAVIN